MKPGPSRSSGEKRPPQIACRHSKLLEGAGLNRGATWKPEEGAVVPSVAFQDKDALLQRESVAAEPDKRSERRADSGIRRRLMWVLAGGMGSAVVVFRQELSSSR